MKKLSLTWINLNQNLVLIRVIKINDKLIPKDKYNNLNRKGRQDLYKLKKDKNIVIKGADKGSAVVV